MIYCKTKNVKNAVNYTFSFNIRLHSQKKINYNKNGSFPKPFHPSLLLILKIMKMFDSSFPLFSLRSHISHISRNSLSSSSPLPPLPNSLCGLGPTPVDYGRGKIIPNFRKPSISGTLDWLYL